MAYPVPAEYAVNQRFRSYATAGVVGRPDGSEIQYLVWLYGDYQPYGHAGADIACPIGTPVYAIADGIVVWADWGYKLPGDDSWGPNGYFKRWGMYKNFPGICTVIWHPQLNKFSIYGHQSSNDEVKVGQQVREGQQIGESGNTKTNGETVGPHLHIAVVGDYTNYSTGGKYIFGCEDPLPYFNTGSLSYASESIEVLEEDDMAIFNSIDEFKKAVGEAVQESHKVTRTHIIEKVTENTEAQHVETRKQVIDMGQAQEDVTRGYLADRVRDASPADVVAAIPDDIAQQVIDGLATRLAGGAQ